MQEMQKKEVGYLSIEVPCNRLLFFFLYSIKNLAKKAVFLLYIVYTNYVYGRL